MAYLAALLIGTALCQPRLASAQVDVREAEATRAQLESLYARLTPKQRVFSEAVALKERLDEGDFRAGDRIILEVRGDTALSDTFAVNTNGAIELPNIGPVPLHGVLRSELQAHLTEVLSQYLKSPEITAKSLIRIAVIGQVGRPGFLYLPATTVAADAFAAAGGLTQTSNLKKTKILRNGQVLLEGQPLQNALASGRSLDQMNMQSGDEIQVGQKSTGGAGNAIIWIGAIAGAILTISALVSLVAH
jgi:protein involved in polysaccharide export with SLBB domain